MFTLLSQLQLFILILFKFINKVFELFARKKENDEFGGHCKDDEWSLNIYLLFEYAAIITNIFVVIFFP